MVSLRQLRELTEQGEQIARRARTILAAVRDLLDYAKHQEGVLAGVLKLGAIPSIAPYLLPAALPELQRRFPELSLQLRETVTATLVHELVAGDLDLIVVALPIDDPDVETFHLFDDRFVLAMKASQANRRQSHASTEMCWTIVSFCSRRGTAYAIRRCPTAAWLRPRRARASARRASRPSCRWWPTAMASHSCRRWPLPARSTPPTAFVSCPSARRNRGGRSASPGARPRCENGISSNSPSCCAKPRRSRKRPTRAMRSSAIAAGVIKGVEIGGGGHVHYPTYRSANGRALRQGRGGGPSPSGLGLLRRWPSCAGDVQRCRYCRRAVPGARLSRPHRRARRKLGWRVALCARRRRGSGRHRLSDRALLAQFRRLYGAGFSC